MSGQTVATNPVEKREQRADDAHGGRAELGPQVGDAGRPHR